MTIEEAVGLVLEAAKMAEGGETFVLDMGEPVRIVDLVRNYATEMHFPQVSVNIQFTGLRQGEKLNETLFASDEEAVATAHPRVLATKSSQTEPELMTLIERLGRAAIANRDADVRALFAQLFPTYRPAPSKAGELLMAGPYPDGF